MSLRRAGRFLRRPARALAWLLAGLFVLAMLAYLALPFIISTDWVRGRLLGLANRELAPFRLRLSLESIELSYGTKLSLAGLRLSGPEGELAYIKAVEAGPLFPGILGTPPRIPDILIDEPAFTLRRDRDGAWELGRLLAGPPGEEEEAQEEKGPAGIGIEIRKIRVRGASVALPASEGSGQEEHRIALDLAGALFPKRVEVSSLSLSDGNASLSGSAQASFSEEGPAGASLSLSAKSLALYRDLLPGLPALNDLKAAIAASGSIQKPEARVSASFAPQQELSVVARADLDEEKARAEIEFSRIDLAAFLENPPTRLSGDLAAELSGWDMARANASLLLSLADSEAAGITIASARLDLEKRETRLERLALSAKTGAGNLTLSGSGPVSGLLRPEERVKLALAAIFEKLNPAVLAGDEKLAGDLAGRLDLDLAKAEGRALTQSELALSLSLDPSRLGRLEDLSLTARGVAGPSGFRVDEGRIKAEGALLLFAGKGNYQGEGQASLSVFAGDISGLTGLFLEEPIEGAVQAEIEADNGPGHDLFIKADLDAQKLRFADMSLGSLSIEGLGRPLVCLGSFRLRASDIELIKGRFFHARAYASGDGSKAAFSLDAKDGEGRSLSAAGSALDLDRPDKRILLSRMGLKAPGIELASAKQAEISISPKGYRVKDLVLSGKDQEISFSGRYSDGGDMDLAARVRDLDLAAWGQFLGLKDALRGRAWAAVSASGALSRPVAELSLQLKDFSAADEMPGLSAKAEASYGEGLAAASVTGESEAGAFSLTASLPLDLSIPMAPDWEPWKRENPGPMALAAGFRTESMEKLAKLLKNPYARGKGKAWLQVSGGFRAPRIELSAEVADFTLDEEMPLVKARLTASYGDEHARLEARGSSEEADFSLAADTPLALGYPLAPGWEPWAPGRRGPLSVNAHVESQQMKKLRLLSGLPGLSGKARVELALSGTTDAPRARIDIRAQDFRTSRELPRMDAEIRIDADPKQAELRGSIGKPGMGDLLIEAHASSPEGFLREKGPAAWARELENSLAAKLSASDLDLGELLRSHWRDRKASGRMSLHITARGPLQKPEASADISISDFQGRAGIPRLTATLTAAAGARGLTAQVSGVPENGGSLEAEAKLDGPFSLPGLGEKKLKASLKAQDLSLSFLRSFTDQLTEISATLSADASLKGSLSRPEPSGSLTLAGDKVMLAGLPEPFHEIAGNITFSNKKIVLEKFGAALGATGIIAASGSAALSGTELSSISANLTARDLNIDYREMLAMAANAEVSLSGNWPCFSLSGKVDVGEGRFRLDRFLSMISPDVNLDPDIQFADMPLHEPARVPSVFLNSKVAVSVNVAGPFWVKGAGAQVQLSGELKGVKACGEREPALLGKLSTVRGLYEFRGKTFSIRKGVVNFLGERPPNPLIDVSADYRVSDVTITLMIGGSLSRMALALSSDPPMTETDIASYLLFGKPAGGLSGGQSASLMDQGASFFGSQMLKNLQEIGGVTVPVDVFSISPGGAGGGTSLTLGKYLTPDLFVIYRRGALGEASDELSVEYTLGRGFSLQSTVSDQGSGADILWGTEY